MGQREARPVVAHPANKVRRIEAGRGDIPAVEVYPQTDGDGVLLYGVFHPIAHGGGELGVGGQGGGKVGEVQDFRLGAVESQCGLFSFVIVGAGEMRGKGVFIRGSGECPERGYFTLQLHKGQRPIADAGARAYIGEQGQLFRTVAVKVAGAEPGQIAPGGGPGEIVDPGMVSELKKTAFLRVLLVPDTIEGNIFVRKLGQKGGARRFGQKAGKLRLSVHQRLGKGGGLAVPRCTLKDLRVQGKRERRSGRE